MSIKTSHKQNNLKALPLHYNKLRSLTLQTIDFATGYRWYLYFPFMVFPKYKIVFLAVPRSGTSSLEKALTPLLGNYLDLESDRYKHIFRHFMRSCTRREAATKYDSYFKFTFVRNPWTRLFSCYLAKVRRVPNRHFRLLGLDRCRTFEDFVMRVCDIPDEYADEHFMSQDYLLTYQGKFLPDQVYRFETYSEDWNNLRQNLEQQTGVELLGLPHIFKTKSDDFRREYTSRLVDLVGERYRADCNRFEYTYPG
jgi:hypothetical protein